MALISMRQLLDHAAENSYGIPAFNVNNLEQIILIVQLLYKQLQEQENMQAQSFYGI